jgi:hypothetical protein
MCEITGTIKSLNLHQEVTATFVKSEVVIVSDSQYPQTIIVEFSGQKSDLLDLYGIGEEVKISLNIQGRTWTNPQGVEKVFNSLQGWRVERLNNDVASSNHPTNTPSASQAKPQDYAPNNTGPMSTTEDDDSELPF